MMSGDLKWNKIKEIENVIGLNIEREIYDELDGAHDIPYSKYRKLVDRLVWIQANKLYDIATEGLYDNNEIDDFSRYPEHWSDVLNRVIDLASYNNPHYFSLSVRDVYWQQYDYLNS